MTSPALQRIPGVVKLAALAISLTILTACQPKIAPLTEEEKHHMTRLAATMTTRCLGRYLIDLPREIVLMPNSLQTIKVEDVEIKVEPMEKVKFAALLQQRATELANSKLNIDPQYPMLHETYPIKDSDGFGSIFNRAESAYGSAGRIRRTLELLGWKNGYVISANVQARDPRFPENTSKNKELLAMGSDVPKKLEHLLSVFRRVHGRADTEIPSVPGLCIPNGMVRGPASSKEHLLNNYYLKDSPDVSMTFHYLPGVGPDNELLDREDAIEQSLKEDNGYTIRKGHVRGQLPGAQEWLMGFKPADELPRQSFTFEANSKSGSATAPLVVLDFGAGSRIPEESLSLDQIATRKPLSKVTLSESEAVALWDAIAPTIRPRPGAF